MSDKNYVKEEREFEHEGNYEEGHGNPYTTEDLGRAYSPRGINPKSSRREENYYSSYRGNYRSNYPKNYPMNLDSGYSRKYPRDNYHEGGYYRDHDDHYEGRNYHHGHEHHYEHEYPYGYEEHRHHHDHHFGPGYEPYNNRPLGLRNWIGTYNVRNWLMKPNVNNFFRGVGIATIGIILAPTIAKAIRPLAVSTVHGVMDIVDEVKGVVSDAKEEIEDIFADAKWQDMNNHEANNGGSSSDNS